MRSLRGDLPPRPAGGCPIGSRQRGGFRRCGPHVSATATAGSTATTAGPDAATTGPDAATTGPGAATTDSGATTTGSSSPTGSVATTYGSASGRDYGRATSTAGLDASARSR